MHVTALVNYNEISIFNQRVIDIINSVGNIAVTSFILISGYFGVSFNWRKFVNLIVTTTVYCLIVAAFRYGNNPIELMKAFLTIPGYNLWFIVCYLILMPLAPYINKLCDSLSKREYRCLMIIFILIFSVIPTLSVSGATNNIVLRMGGKNLTFFMVIYILGRYIRLYHNGNSYNRWKLWGIHLICVASIFLLNMLGYYLFHKRCVIFSFDCSPLAIMSSVCIFYLFKSWNFTSKAINWFSSSVFAFYILSYIFHYFNSKFVHLSDYSYDYSFVVYLMVLVLMSWVFSLLIDKTLGKIMAKLLAKVENYIFPRIKKSNGLYKRISQ